MAILAAFQSASLRLIGRKPTTFFDSNNTFEMEICDLANEVAQDVAKYRDWQALVRFATITGDGSTTEFALPTDYDRQLLITDMQDTVAPFWGYTRILDINAFTNIANREIVSSPGVWALYANQLRFTPAPIDTAVATFPYVSKNLVLDNASAEKEAFTADTDTFALPERLITLGLVWRWREQKKLDSTGDQEAFTKALDEYASKDGGSRVIRSSARRSFPGVRVAYPYELG